MLKWLKRILGRTPAEEKPPSPYDEAVRYYRTIASVNEDIYANALQIEVPYHRIDLYIEALEKLERYLKNPSDVEMIRHPLFVRTRVCDFYLDKDNCVVDMETVPDRFYTLSEKVIQLYINERGNQYKVPKLDYVLRRASTVVENLTEMAKEQIHGTD